MIATIDIADIGVRRTLTSLVRHPRPDRVPGLRWYATAVGAPLASLRPPSFTRSVAIAFWDDEASAAAHAPERQTNDASSSFHAVVRPLRAYGTWPGLPDDVPRSRHTDHEGPVLVTTLGRLRLSQAVRFLRTSRPAERDVLGAPGLLWATAAARPPFVATVSLWESGEASADYAFSDAGAGHPRAVAEQRRKDFHHESAFVRHAIVSASGSLDGMPGIAV